MKPVSLLLAQTGFKLGNKERNLKQISEQASKARKKNVDLLILPELTRLQALQGAELVVCMSASPGLRRRFFEGFCLSRAMENAVYLAYVNRVGIEEGLQFWGGSRVIAPNGSVLAQCKYDLEEF